MDERDRRFLLRRATRAEEPWLHYRYWQNLDQHLSQTGGTCVGHAWAHFLECAPKTHPEPGPFVDPYWIYDRATELDEWLGNDGDRESGTSVRAGWKALRERGVVTEALWSWSLEEITRHVWTTGPLVLGTNWYSSMWDTDANGFLHVSPGARVEGGHAYLLEGINVRTGVVRCQNSWGESWGVARGRFRMDFETLDRLVNEDGEACLALEV